MDKNKGIVHEFMGFDADIYMKDKQISEVKS